MIDYLLTKISLLVHWAYFLIFLLALLETAAFFGHLVPGETVVVFSGFLASQDVLELGDCFWVVALGAIVGDSIGYEIGRRFDQSYFEKHERFLFLKKQHLNRAQLYFQQHGRKTVFLGRFIGFLRAFAPLIAGMSRMPYQTFLIYNVLGGLLWTLTFTLLGYFFGHSWKIVENWAGKLGLFLFLTVLLLAGGSYLAKQLLSRQGAIFSWAERKWIAFVKLPYIQQFSLSHPDLIRFLKDRVSAKHYLGLHLTIGLGISAIFVRIFSELAENVLEHGPLVRLDQWVLNKTAYLQSPVMNQVMSSITFLGDRKTLMVSTILLVTVLFLKRAFAKAATVLAAMAGGGILSQVIKFAIHRERPVAEYQLIEAKGFSFPSGHSMMSAIFFGLLIYLVLQSNLGSRTKVIFAAIGGALIILIGLSRIYLGVHFLSDVLAGFVGGIFYFILCITGFEVYSKRSASLGNERNDLTEQRI